jgi:uncharacterized protein (TIGR01777 family)
MKRKIVINGGTGMLGKKLTNALLLKGYNILMLSRNPLKYKNAFDSNISFYKFDSLTSSEELSGVLNGCYGIINLAGASIAERRWTEQYKKELYDSRIIPTRNISEAIVNLKIKPDFFINTSATGIYGNRGDEILNEGSSIGNDYLANLCRDWESEALIAKKHTRTLTVRIGVVLDEKGGALKKLILPFKLFAGGHLGNGKQFIPWVHIEDLIRSFLFIIDIRDLSGAVIASSPNPARNKDFSRDIGKVLSRPAFLPAPGSGLKILLGEFAEFLLASQRTVPLKLLNNGFEFKFPDSISALNSLLNDT